MKLLDIKISRYTQIIRGLLLFSNNQWCFINENEVDYILNGYMFINMRYIKNLKEISEETLEYKILKLKYVPKIIPETLDTYEKLLTYLKQQNKLISVGLESSNFILVGKIDNIFKKSFMLRLIGADAKESSVYKVNFSKIRYISVETDYLNSIELYINSQS